MIILVIPFFFIELYISLKVGENIGFAWSVLWIIGSFLLGMRLLKKSSYTVLDNIEAVKKGKLDIASFKSANLSYFIGSILLIIPGVFSDFLGLISLFYAFYLQTMAKIRPEQTNFQSKQGDDNVIDVEIIDEYSSSNCNS